MQVTLSGGASNSYSSGLFRWQVRQLSSQYASSAVYLKEHFSRSTSIDVPNCSQPTSHAATGVQECNRFLAPAQYVCWSRKRHCHFEGHFWHFPDFPGTGLHALVKLCPTQRKLCRTQCKLCPAQRMSDSLKFRKCIALSASLTY